MRPRRAAALGWRWGLLSGTAVALWSLTAAADPRWNTGVVAGVAGTGGSLWSRTAFYGSVRGDVLFHRESDRDVGFGPSLEVGTVGFSDVRGLAGVVVLAPLGDVFVASLDPAFFLRSSPEGLTPGVSARGFFGLRGYNHTGGYEMQGGLVVGFDKDLGGPHDHALVVAAQVDGLLLALPVVLLASWIRGPRH